MLDKKTNWKLAVDTLLYSVSAKCLIKYQNELFLI